MYIKHLHITIYLYNWTMKVCYGDSRGKEAYTFIAELETDFKPRCMSNLGLVGECPTLGQLYYGARQRVFKQKEGPGHHRVHYLVLYYASVYLAMDRLILSRTV